MKCNPGIVLALLLASAAAQADKPAWSGEEQLQKQQHKQEMKAKGHGNKLVAQSATEATQSPKGQTQHHQEMGAKARNEKLMAQSEAAAQSPKGLSKQQQRTVEQQKELAKGSETGQSAREKRKKWWRFWE